MPDPLYTAENCKAAYQLRWSLALFAKTALPPAARWSEPLRAVTERDGVRLLESHFKEPNAWLFLVSTVPEVTPPQIVKSVKGRLQSLVRDAAPQAFRRNFSLTSVGDAKRQVIETYVADQLGHHRMADAAVQSRLKRFQLTFPDVDLSQPKFSSHGRYLYNLHFVLVHQERWCEVREEQLERTRDMILAVAQKKQHRVSRLALFADHVHVAVGCRYEESPQTVALGYLNNLAYAHGMQPVYCYSYYVGTFGEYDMGAVWRGL